VANFKIAGQAYNDGSTKAAMAKRFYSGRQGWFCGPFVKQVGAQGHPCLLIAKST
jgi:hypothetical protein